MGLHINAAPSRRILSGVCPQSEERRNFGDRSGDCQCKGENTRNATSRQCAGRTFYIVFSEEHIRPEVPERLVYNVLPCE